jgi:hypothetical protein
VYCCGGSFFKNFLNEKKKMLERLICLLVEKKSEWKMLAITFIRPKIDTKE